MAIRIFITGGTFDKEYNELNGQLYFKDTHVQDLLEMGRCRLNTEIRTLMMIDSLEMTAEDRDLIIHQCNQCEDHQTAQKICEDFPSKTLVGSVGSDRVGGRACISLTILYPHMCCLRRKCRDCR